MYPPLLQTMAKKHIVKGNTRFSVIHFFFYCTLLNGTMHVSKGGNIIVNRHLPIQCLLSPEHQLQFSSVSSLGHFLNASSAIVKVLDKIAGSRLEKFIIYLSRHHFKLIYAFSINANDAFWMAKYYDVCWKNLNIFYRLLWNKIVELCWLFAVKKESDHESKIMVSWPFLETARRFETDFIDNFFIIRGQ